MRLLRSLVLLLVLTEMVTLVSGCRNDSQQHDGLSKNSASVSDTIADSLAQRSFMRLLENADYRDDFEKAIEKGDMRFVGIMGYALEVPGAPDYDEVYSQNYGVKIIEGTSDSYPDAVSFARSVFFESYATSYNTLLLDYLKTSTE